MILSHIHRAIHAGNDWDAHGPRFRLGPDGRPVRDGNFDDPTGWNWRRLFKLNDASDADAIALTVSLIAEGMRELERRYPGIAVHVVYWGSGASALGPAARAQLAALGLPPHRADAVVPRENHLIDDRLDRHPNALGHRALARYVLREIVGFERSD